MTTMQPGLRYRSPPHAANDDDAARTPVPGSTVQLAVVQEAAHPEVRQNWSLVAAAVVLLGLLSILYTLPSGEAPVAATAIPGDLLAAAPELEVPIQQFPDLAKVPGHLLQVGLFNKLNGAETRQMDLMRLGLTTTIRIRVMEGMTRYAVTIGPVAGDDYADAVATLEANAVTFFHREVPLQPAYSAEDTFSIMHSAHPADSASL